MGVCVISLCCALILYHHHYIIILHYVRRIERIYWFRPYKYPFDWLTEVRNTYYSTAHCVLLQYNTIRCSTVQYSRAQYKCIARCPEYCTRNVSRWQVLSLKHSRPLQKTKLRYNNTNNINTNTKVNDRQNTQKIQLTSQLHASGMKKIVYIKYQNWLRGFPHRLAFSYFVYVLFITRTQQDTLSAK